MRLIDADELKNVFEEHEDRRGDLDCDWRTLINNVPTVEQLPRVEHIVVDKINGDTGKITYHSADMRGEENGKYLKYDAGYSDTQTVKDETIDGYSDTQTILDNDLISRSELKTKLEFGICHYCEHYNKGKYDNDCGICKVSRVFQIVDLMEEMKGSTEE